MKTSYVERMNRVLDHILSDLTRPLRLIEMAELAGISPFHFHRVFQAMLGETPGEFVNRLRLEKSLSLMSFGKRKSLTTIALDCGFSSSSDFSRSFKLRYGVAPSKFDLTAWRTEHGKRLESTIQASSYHLKKSRPRANPDQFRVRIRELPARRVAYIRVSNPYQGNGVTKAAQRLLAWAEAHDLAHGQWLGYQFESPKATALESCLYCVGVEVASEIKPHGEIGLYRFPAMRVAEVAMSGDVELEMRLFEWLYGNWLPQSRYVPADQPAFEAWLGKPFAHGLEHYELSVQLPIDDAQGTFLIKA